VLSFGLFSFPNRDLAKILVMDFYPIFWEEVSSSRILNLLLWNFKTLANLLSILQEITSAST